MNKLEISFRTRKVEPVLEPDKRYRVLVQLIRSDRPRFWKFHCPHCKHPLVELQNKDIEVITDFYDPQNLNNGAVGIRCDGPYCRYYFYFTVS